MTNGAEGEKTDAEALRNMCRNINSFLLDCNKKQDKKTT